MKILLTTLNSKFIHSNLAIRYLKEYVRDISSVKILEYTINQTLDSVISSIYMESPDLIGFSTYIWNIEQTLEICQVLKIIKPEIKILLGGPEVSFDARALMENHGFIDYIIYGEGEESFKEIVIGKELCYIDGLVFRDSVGDVIINPPRKLMSDLDKIPSPYENVGDDFKNRIVYYESSRGCPFNCEFCLSSTIKGVRYFGIERVKSDIARLVKLGVSQIKFVDRTFNANKSYSMEIMKYIMDLNPDNINFHFEVTAHLIDEETLEFLKMPKEGLFQFEVGVQTTNKATIESIGRITDFIKLKEVTTRIKSYRNIHQHLDLIAGLPFEDYRSFENSFNDVYSIRPEKLQLGFLKLLKGSGLRLNEKKYGYKYLNKPPYEVLENNYLDYSGLIKLKGIEDLVEKYYNEGYFIHSLVFIITNFFDNPFKFYEDFSVYWKANDLFDEAHSRNGLYQILLDYYKDSDFSNIESFYEILKFDYISNNKKLTLPVGIDRSEYNLSQSDIHELLKDSELLGSHLPEYKEIATKKLIKNVIIEAFNVDIFEIIKNGYKPSNEEKVKYILFEYRDLVINRCRTSDITKFVTKR